MSAEDSKSKHILSFFPDHMECPVGFSKSGSAAQSCCYKVFDSPQLGWQVSHDHCLALGPRYSFGGFETADEWNTVRTEINANFPSDNIWVAAAWNDACNAYVWLNGDIPVEDSMWGIPVPTSNSGCVYLKGSSALLYLAISCVSPNRFLCEYS